MIGQLWCLTAGLRSAECARWSGGVTRPGESRTQRQSYETESLKAFVHQTCFFGIIMV